MFKRLTFLRNFFCNNLTRQTPDQSSIFRTRRTLIKDRFDLHTLTNIDYMCYLVRTNKYKLTHQENIALFYRMSQVFEILNKSVYYYDEFKLMSERVLANFRNPDDVASMGTFIKGMTKVGMYQQEQWEYIFDFIEQRKYSEEHDEVFGIITGFKHIKEKFSGTWLEQKTVHIYRQLFDVTLLHMKQRRYNLKEMREIVHCFHKYGVNEDYIWDEVQYFLRTKLRELEQKPFTNHVIVHEAEVERVLFDSKVQVVPILEELVEIAYVLAYNKMPTLEFIQFSEKLVSFYLKNKKGLEEEYQRVLEVHNSKASEKGKEPLLEHQKQLGVVKMNPIFLSNQNIIYFLFVLKRTMDSHKEYHLDRQLYQWAINMVFEDHNRYTVSEIILLNHVHQFLQKTPQEMQAFTLNKIKIVRENTVKLNDLKSLFEIVGPTNLDNLHSLIHHFLFTSHPSQIYLFTRFCEGYKAYIPQYFVELPHMVNQHHKYFSFDQNCYFYYILLTNEVYWQGCALNSYHGEMEILKETIKTSAFSRGFKITMDSYFHKLLEHVNLADFFEGGN